MFIFCSGKQGLKSFLYTYIYLSTRSYCRAKISPESYVVRTLEVLNALLISNPEWDLFADGWNVIEAAVA